MTFVEFFEYTLLGLGVLTVGLLWQRSQRFEVLLFLMAVLIGLAIEVMGVKVHRLYYYSDKFSVVLWGAPLAILFGWGLLTYCMNRFASALPLKWWMIAGPAGLMAVCLDLVLDPMLSNAVQTNLTLEQLKDASVEDCMGSVGALLPSTLNQVNIHGNPIESGYAGIGAGLWVWCLPNDPDLVNEHIFGVPSTNFISWFAIVAAFIFSRQYFTRDLEAESLPLAKQLFLAGKVGFVALIGIVIVLVTCRYMFYNFGLSGFLMLALFCGAGLFAFFCAGTKREPYGFDVLAFALIALNTVHWWVAYFLDYVVVENMIVIQILLFLNLLVVALALWCMMARSESD